MAAAPEIGEYVLATVAKIMPYGAFLTLDEYGNLEGFLHISEVSSGWVKNIREYVKEGQKVVVMISRVDYEKRQIDLSLKRVSDNDRKRKLESYQLGKRAEKLLERAALKLKKTLKDAHAEVLPVLLAEYGELFPAFEAIHAGATPKIPPAWLKALKEVADAEIKEKEVRVRAKLTLQSFEGDGVEHLKRALQVVAKAAPGIHVQYVGAPQYFIDITDKEFKSAEKTLVKIQTLLEGEKKIEFSIAKIKA